MNPVQKIVLARLAAEAARVEAINEVVVEATAKTLISLAESPDYQISRTHFMDALSQEAGSLGDVDWNNLVYTELSSIDGISVWLTQGRYVISTSSDNLMQADLSKYFK